MTDRKQQLFVGLVFLVGWRFSGIPFNFAVNPFKNV